MKFEARRHQETPNSRTRFLNCDPSLRQIMQLLPKLPRVSPPFYSESAGRSTAVTTPLRPLKSQTPHPARHRQAATLTNVFISADSRPWIISAAWPCTCCAMGSCLPATATTTTPWGLAQLGVHSRCCTRERNAQRSSLDRRKAARGCADSSTASAGPPGPEGNPPGADADQQSPASRAEGGSPPPPLATAGPSAASAAEPSKVLVP